MHLPVLQEDDPSRSGGVQARIHALQTLRTYLGAEERQTEVLSQLQIGQLGFRSRPVHVQEMLAYMDVNERRDPPQMPRVPEQIMEQGARGGPSAQEEGAQGGCGDRTRHRRMP